MMDKKDISFNRFTDGEKNADKLQLWVQAMKRVNEDGIPWAPVGKFIHLLCPFLEGMYGFILLQFISLLIKSKPICNLLAFLFWLGQFFACFTQISYEKSSLLYLSNSSLVCYQAHIRH